MRYYVEGLETTEAVFTQCIEAALTEDLPLYAEATEGERFLLMQCPQLVVLPVMAGDLLQELLGLVLGGVGNQDSEIGVLKEPPDSVCDCVAEGERFFRMGRK